VKDRSIRQGTGWATEPLWNWWRGKKFWPCHESKLGHQSLGQSLYWDIPA